MLKKRLRLRSPEVALVMKSGRSLRSAHLQVKIVSTSGPFRSAAVAPKAVARKAVARNSLRRALYRALAKSDTSKLKGDAVFFVRLVPKTNVAAIFSEEIATLLLKLN